MLTKPIDRASANTITGNTLDSIFATISVNSNHNLTLHYSNLSFKKYPRALKWASKKDNKGTDPDKIYVYKCCVYIGYIDIANLFIPISFPTHRYTYMGDMHDSFINLADISLIRVIIDNTINYIFHPEFKRLKK